MNNLSERIRVFTDKNKASGKTKGGGLYTLTSFSLAEDLEQIILTVKSLNEGGGV